MSPEIWIGLGSNLGDRMANLAAGLEGLSGHAEILRVSSVYDTEPWGRTDQPPFLNAVCSLLTEIDDPLRFLDILKEIEEHTGRREDVGRWGPRILDLDILMWGQADYRHERLTIPHPEMTERRFVLAPLAELVPDLYHPIAGYTIGELLTRCQDGTEVHLRGRLPDRRDVTAE